MPEVDGLDAWIDALRTRLARGDLSRLPPFELGYGTRHLAGQTTVRVMLADLADLEASDGSTAGDPSWRDERLRQLRAEFRWLRALLDPH